MKKFVGFCVILAFALIGAEAQNCSKVGAECAPDCTTIMICLANNSTPDDSVKCNSPNPYCVNGACAAKPNAGCIAVPSFKCTDNGTFPDPSDCTKYWDCDAGVATPLQCPSGSVFNTQLNACQRGTKPCSKIDCSKATPIKPYIVYASDPQFYAYCFISGAKTQTYMFKCGEGEVFDTAINDCRISCSAKGYFQAPGNCHGYYYCSSPTAKPTETLLCPLDYVFDGIGCNKDATKCKFP